MSSENAGEWEGKPDLAILFEDFPHYFEGEMIGLAVDGKWESLLTECLRHVTWWDIYEAREYGCKKYSRMNWAESINTQDHKRFMAANLRSIYRHLAEPELEGRDKESGCYHLAHVALRCLIAVEYEWDNAKPVTAWPTPEVKEYPLGTQANQDKPASEWDTAPKWAMWKATDQDGGVYWYESKPEGMGNMEWVTSSRHKISYVIDNYDGAWEESLEARPVK